MGMRNTYNEYGSVAKWLHWIVATGILIMLLLGLVIAYTPSGPIKSIIINTHKSIGLTILMLMVLRLLWRWTNTTPRLPSTTPRWQVFSARWSHALLYIICILMPLEGLAMSTSGGHITNFWWIWKLKMPWIPLNESLSNRLASIHTILAWTLTGLICLHILAALKHHFINQDNVLKRMLAKRESFYFR